MHKYSFWRETSQSPGIHIVDRPADQRPTTNGQPTAEELNYSGNRARQHQRPTNNLLEVWQNLGPFGGRPIGGAVEALLTKVFNKRSSVSPIVVFLLPHAAPLLAC